MMFNEFNRRLESCHLDGETKYLLSHMFEVQVEMGKQLDVAAGLIKALVETVQNFAALHESTQARVKELIGERHAEVKSVRNAEEF